MMTQGEVGEENGKAPPKTEIGGDTMSYWLAIGPPDNWTFCFNNGNVWGFSDRYQNAWESVAIGDTVLCYATRPVMGIIGYCTVRSKQRGPHPFFPREIQQNQVLWPLRLTLAPVRMVPEERWVASRVALERKGVTLQRGLQRLGEERAKKIAEEIDKAYGK